MITLKERFIVDENGQRVGVLLDIEDYRQLLEEVEELEAIRAYDAAKASGDEAVPLEQALAGFDHGVGHCGVCHGRTSMHVDVAMWTVRPRIGRIRPYTMGSSADVEEA